MSHLPPIARSEEPDWYEAMARPLVQVGLWQHRLEVPVLCAGDLFHRWNSPPELINFAMEHLPSSTIAIPGQHDLPSHRTELIQKSAYWTLESAQRIADLSFDRICCLKHDWVVGGIRYNDEITESLVRDLFSDFVGFKKILLVHRYAWYGESKYAGAPPENHIGRIIKKIAAAGVSVVIFGDNHIPWEHIYRTKGDGKKTSTFNCGSLIRRNADERDHRPSIGILFADGTIERIYLDVNSDSFLQIPYDGITDGFELENRVDVTEFLKEVKGLQLSGADFGEAIKRYLDSGVPSKTRDMVLEAINE